MSDNANLTSRKDFKKDKKGQYDYWDLELAAHHKRTRRWHQAGTKIVDKFIDNRGDKANTATDERLNLFHSNISIIQSMLFGNIPKVSVTRKYADADDDTARVASEIAERLLNLDIEDNGATYDSILRAVLQDRLLPGLGVARVRYEVETEEYEDTEDAKVMDEAIGEEITIQKKVTKERVVHESAPIDYFHWRDVAWGWTRMWSDVPWVAFRSYLNKDEATIRFKKRIADKLDYKTVKPVGDDETALDADLNSNWLKAEVWEIWDKVTNSVVFVSSGCTELLEKPTPDPLELEDFFPCPPFLIANPTTSLYLPTPDYKLSEDLYLSIDVLQTRISIITDAVKVVGLYDQKNADIGRMFKEAMETELIPVDNWAMLAEQGGLRGAIDWFPIADVTEALDRLMVQRDTNIELLHQINGMSDILRGGGTKERESATAQGLKAKFGSARLQGIQDTFAGFVGSLMQLKLEVISKHFLAKTIIEQSNLSKTYDMDKAQEAVELIKTPGKMKLRVTVEAESLAMIDFAQKKQERTEFLEALTNYMKAAAGMIKVDPSSRPFLMQMLQWGLAGFKGSQQIEGVLDKAIKAAEDNPMQGDDKGQQQDAKKRADLEKIEAQKQLEQIKQQGKVQEQQAKSMAELQKINAELQATLQKIEAKLNADVKEELEQSKINIEQTTLQTENEMERDDQDHENDLELADVEHAYNLEEIAAQQEDSDDDG